MLVSLLAWIYFFVANKLDLSNDLRNSIKSQTVEKINSNSVYLTNTYGFSSGDISSQYLNSLPLVGEVAESMTKKMNNRMLGFQRQEKINMQVEEHFSEGEIPLSFDPRIINVRVDKQNTMGIQNGGKITIPAVDDLDTIMSLAKIASNAYLEVEDTQGYHWYPEDPFLREDRFGWDEAAIRGYVYTNPSRTLVIMAIKGTSTAIFDGSGHTVAADKFNDNLMFSCCCARVDLSWDTVCPCYQENETCEFECLVDYAKRQRSFPFKKNITNIDEFNTTEIIETTSIYPVYYSQAIKIFQRLQADYPKATIWLTGHSLGGSLASLLAMTFPGTAAVAFSAPGERLFAERLQLIPKRTKTNEKEIEKLMSNLPIFHIYNTADPIPYGKCSGIWSLCYIAGYAMESKCHLGQVCEYDLGQGKAYDLQKHTLGYMIDKIMMGNYPPPKCRVESRCTDCQTWNYV